MTSQRRRPSWAWHMLLRLTAVGIFLFLGFLVISQIPLAPDHHGIEALEEGDIMVGASLGAWPTDSEPVIKDFEELTGARLDVVDVFLDWYTPFDNVSHTLEHIARGGAIPMLSWEPHGFTTAEIVAGNNTAHLRDGRALKLHAYMDEFARGTCGIARSTGQPVLVRPMHEMNGDWFTWSTGYTTPNGDRPNTDETYRAAWILIHDAFEQHCAGKILFVWAVNHFSKGEASSFTGTYPGDDYVDFVGLDGYNWGGQASWGWQTFEEIFRPSYCAVAAATDKPILIAEVASTEEGGDKAAWISSLFRHLVTGDYPGLTGVVYFNTGKWEVEVHGEMDWRVDSSPQSLEAFRQGVEDVLDLRAADQGVPAAEPDCK